MLLDVPSKMPDLTRTVPADPYQRQKRLVRVGDTQAR